MKFKDYCIKEGIVGGTARQLGKAAYAVGGTLMGVLGGAIAIVLADVLKESPYFAAALAYIPTSLWTKYRGVFNKTKDGKIQFNPDEFQKLDDQDQKKVLVALKEAFAKQKKENPEAYKNAKKDMEERLSSVKDEKQREQLANLFRQIFTESTMESFKRFLENSKVNDLTRKANKEKATAAQANAKAEKADADAAVAKAKQAQQQANNQMEEEEQLDEAETYGSKDKDKTSGKDAADAKRDANGVRIPTRHVGVYAGGNGKSKPIPYTQDPEMKNQAVGPKVDDDEDGDDIEDANPEPEKKNIAPVYSVPGLGESEDPTINQGYDAMYDSFNRDMNSGKSDWQKMEESMKSRRLDESCGPSGCSLPVPSSENIGMGSGGIMSVPGLGGGIIGARNSEPRMPAVVDKSEIYAYIKNQGLHDGNREHAMSLLLSKFGANPEEELSTVLDDAIMSTNPDEVDRIDKLYNYQDTLNFERPEAELPGFLNQAWQQMENSNDLKDL